MIIFPLRLGRLLRLVAMCCLLVAPASQVGAAQISPSRDLEPDEKAELNLLLVDVTLDGDLLADVINVYEFRDDILLPVGELARLLTVGITVDPNTKVASGFILKENRPFRLDPAIAEVSLPDGKEPYDKLAIRWIDGDLYVSRRLLQRWWPIDFALNLAQLNVDVKPREKLPVQLRLEREKAASLLRGGTVPYHDPGFPRLGNNYRLFSIPFIDNTLGISINRNGRKTTSEIAYSGFLTGDLLGMEAQSYLSFSKDDPKPKARLTLSRHQPDGGLFGPLDATLVAVGNIGLPALENVLRGGIGNGFVLSNRPLDQPTSYGMQTLRGELPQGWDATLYFNDAVIAFAQSRSDGLYEFPDLPLAFGRNEFRIVLHGPLGQTRIERQAYQLDPVVTKPGRFYYSFAGQREDQGGAIRQTAQLDLGLFKNVAATLGEVYIDKHDGQVARSYLHAGVRVAALGSLINVDRTQDFRGGALTQVGLRTKFFGVSVDANRLWLSNFQSDVFGPSGDPLRSQDRLRLIGAVSLGGSRKLPFAIDMTHERTRAGVEMMEVNQRLSVNMLGTSLTNSIGWNRTGGSDSVGGALQLSRWIAGAGLSGQLAYTLLPIRKLGSLAVTADKSLSENDRLRLGLLHDFSTRENTATFGLNRNLGKFGVGISGRFSGLGNLSLGLQLFTALGRDSRSGRIMQDWRPTAGLGQVSAHVFVDGNLNGIYDKGEENIANAGFTVNGGSRQQANTNNHGIALLNQLQTSVYADIALEQATLEDPQWLPERPGLRLLPRAGRMRVVDLPVVLTAEIDGVVYLSEQGVKRVIGDAHLELVDGGGKVVGTSRSASDGYYIMPSVRPGHYRLRVSHEQLLGLNLVADREPDITINAKAEFVNGVDFTVMAKSLGSAAAPSTTPTVPAPL